jgi:hypothetical protein
MKWSKINPDGTAWEGSFLVTRPGEKEGKKYGLIRFQEIWGACIDGASAE